MGVFQGAAGGATTLNRKVQVGGSARLIRLSAQLKAWADMRTEPFCHPLCRNLRLKGLSAAWRTSQKTVFILGPVAEAFKGTLTNFLNFIAV